MACMCMGPQRGEPLCPCMMRAARQHIMGGTYMPSFVSGGVDDPHADHDDTYLNDGEVRCACCKQILHIERGEINHTCPTAD